MGLELQILIYFRLTLQSTAPGAMEQSNGLEIMIFLVKSVPVIVVETANHLIVHTPRRGMERLDSITQRMTHPAIMDPTPTTADSASVTEKANNNMTEEDTIETFADWTNVLEALREMPDESAPYTPATIWNRNGD